MQYHYCPGKKVKEESFVMKNSGVVGKIRDSGDDHGEDEI